MPDVELATTEGVVCVLEALAVGLVVLIPIEEVETEVEGEVEAVEAEEGFSTMTEPVM